MVVVESSILSGLSDSSSRYKDEVLADEIEFSLAAAAKADEFLFEFFRPKSRYI